MQKLKTEHIAGAIMGLLMIGGAIIFFRGKPYFMPLIFLGVLLAVFQFLWDMYLENQRQKEIEEKFPEFVRNLTGAIKSGMPAPKAILHVAHTDYGALSPHVRKLANQVEWSIPLHKALLTFSTETANKVINRAISTVIEAELSGGNMEDVLGSVTKSVIEIKKIKQKRKATVFAQIIQSYIIFFVFLGIMIVIQNMLIPYVTSVSSGALSGLTAANVQFAPTGDTTLLNEVTIQFYSFNAFYNSFKLWLISFQGVLLMLALLQGLFAGVILGKLSEGDLKSGLKHSFVLMTVAFMVITFSQGF
ncbi:type II secretion system F family protein [Candidatus Woesearchaeota archaeon]|nr:type II secretion system F family protein [Candidatus Woesearchaeota archaeon]